MIMVDREGGRDIEISERPGTYSNSPRVSRALQWWHGGPLADMFKRDITRSGGGRGSPDTVSPC
jgi:hypothetical protein